MRAWILTLASAALGGCFSPDYGAGGFACTNNECPEGYSCVVEGTAKVCRRSGAQPDLARPDRPRGDLGPSPDTKRDGKRPDLPKTDAAPPPACAKPFVVATGTQNDPQSFDQLLDGSGSPHILFVDAKTNVSYAVYKGSWSVTALPFSASQVAVALSSETSGRLQAAFRALDAGFAPRLWHTYRDLPSGSWAKPVMVSTTLAAVNADIAAYKNSIYIAATGKAGGPVLEMYRAVSSGPGYEYPLYASQPNDYSHARVGVSAASAGITAFLQAGLSTAWALRRDPHGAGPGAQQSVPGNQSGPPGPAAVVMDPANQLDVALVRGKALGNNGTLLHVEWTGVPTDKPVETPVVGVTFARSSSVDIALDPAGQPVIGYYDEAAGEVRLARRDTSNKWTFITVATAKNAVNTRVAVFNAAAHVAFDAGALGLDLYYTTCPLP